MDISAVPWHIDKVDIAALVMTGAVIAMSLEVAFRSAIDKLDKTLDIRIAKVIMGLTLCAKNLVFATLHDLGRGCRVAGKLADMFYHISVLAGSYVLFRRVDAIVPIHLKHRFFHLHIAILILRAILSVVDIVLVQVGHNTQGVCVYTGNYYWSPLYTIVDMLIDMYVTFMIIFILVRHIRLLMAADVPSSISLYFAVIYNNSIRTFLLTIVSLFSAVFLLLRDPDDAVKLIWAVINLFFVILIGYDADVTKGIRRLQRFHWRNLVVLERHRESAATREMRDCNEMLRNTQGDIQHDCRLKQQSNRGLSWYSDPSLHDIESLEDQSHHGQRRPSSIFTDFKQDNEDA
ncbi:uncharacterized protein BYT42DRAFT_575712 [Radiomyces spectabilis]|uniref:uncharacterized protein n=1 Tax=Radiomyces spectabilis TaxID=64574 RepID=UPI00221E3CB8|nr:uncharacterized protein BYT42DRAFT_575712 [Radiomyces spectabilis]KAI8374251.1 hypothetical protein BYT42DRAFT_575712 [Radiomyces spectabilis]